MKNGERWEGDILVGADGIHSKVCTPEQYVYLLMQCTPLAVNCDMGMRGHVAQVAYSHQMQMFLMCSVSALPNVTNYIIVCCCVAHVHQLTLIITDAPEGLSVSVLSFLGVSKVLTVFCWCCTG